MEKLVADARRVRNVAKTLVLLSLMHTGDPRLLHLVLLLRSSLHLLA